MAWATIDLAQDLGYDLAECWLGSNKYGLTYREPTIDALAAVESHYLTEGRCGNVAWDSALLRGGGELEYVLIDGTHYIHGGSAAGQYVRPADCALCRMGVCEGIGGRLVVCECVGWYGGSGPECVDFDVAELESGNDSEQGVETKPETPAPPEPETDPDLGAMVQRLTGLRAAAQPANAGQDHH
jgi:hypothetical protein